MVLRLCLLMLVASLFPKETAAQSEEHRLTISAPQELVETGFLRHLFPRFSLKNGIPITVVAPGEAAQASFSTAGGTPVFGTEDTVWHLALEPAGEGNPYMEKLLGWLTSDVGARTMESFAGPPAFRQVVVAAAATEEVAIDGDLDRGAALSLQHCGRCHVIGPKNAMAGVGSTPSFAVLRTFDDWVERFEAFYVLKPHPSFSEVEGITPPFEEGRAPTIAPVKLTLEELADITAYAASLTPADLGAPIRHQ